MGPVLAPADEQVFPGKDWANASPESQGVDPEKLRAAVDYLDRELKEYGGAGTLFIVRNGYVIWAGPECDRQYQIFSATKSFTSTVLGLLIDDGKVGSTLGKDLDSALSAQYPTVTLRHFATMTSGYDSVGGSYEFDDQKRGDSWNPGPPAPALPAGEQVPVLGRRDVAVRQPAHEGGQGAPGPRVQKADCGPHRNDPVALDGERLARRSRTDLDRRNPHVVTGVAASATCS